MVSLWIQFSLRDPLVPSLRYALTHQGPGLALSSRLRHIEPNGTGIDSAILVPKRRVWIELASSDF